MERYLGLDVHAASCTLAVVSQTGKRPKGFPGETNGQALAEAIRIIPGRKHLVFEEGYSARLRSCTRARCVGERNESRSAGRVQSALGYQRG